MKIGSLHIFFVIVFSIISVSAYSQIIISDHATEIERYAGLELQRYIYQLTGELMMIAGDRNAIHSPSFIIGTIGSNRKVAELVRTGLVHIDGNSLGPQGYLLKKITVEGSPVIVIAGGDAVGSLYGVYGLLDDHYDVGFYFSGDVLLPEKKRLSMPDVNEIKMPSVYIRGFLPWTNFPQSATSYSWEDWKFIIDQAARMRLNFIHIHNYNFGSKDFGHNEMFHNFGYKGYLSRVWMPKASTGHAWNCPGWNIGEYRFSAADLFGDYDFGADCALHNERLSNEQIFAKGVSEFWRVIAYAHSRGVKIGLGLDIDVIPDEYRIYGAKADDPEVIKSRVDQIISDYPDLDYLMCFHSESPQEKKDVWQRIFMGMYSQIKARNPKLRMAVAGWGLKPEFVADLPEDVICAPISAYSDGCESGAIYGKREYWGCPWLERDFESSEYYYPYNMHLSNTIKAYQGHASNMKGFYCLTWRLTDAVDAKMSYISKAGWDNEGRYSSSRSVYYEYARRCYGPEAADQLIGIIDQNEAFASDFGECQPTPPLLPIKTNGLLLNLNWFRVIAAIESDLPRINASEFSKQYGVVIADNNSGGKCLGWIENGDWCCYDNVNFGKLSSKIELCVASAADGGCIEIYLDSLESEKIGVCTVSPTGGWQKWQNITVPVNETSGRHTVYLRFRPRLVPIETSDLAKARQQVSLVKKLVNQTDSAQKKYRLSLLCSRLEAEQSHIELNYGFAAMDWNEMPGNFERWAKDFILRVNDISSLGNVASTQNRFVQQHFVRKECELRRKQDVSSPSHVEARGTMQGAVITWKNEQQPLKGFYVYRNGLKINEQPLAVVTREYIDANISGLFEYRVTAIDDRGSESPRSMPAKCLAGESDTAVPQLFVISPPTSAIIGQQASITVRVLDNRQYQYITAELRKREFGEKQWHQIPMERRTKAIFCCDLIQSSGSSFEYYLVVSDGNNIAYWPVGGAAAPASCTIINSRDKKAPDMPKNFRISDGKLLWDTQDAKVIWYKIYRSKDSNFEVGAATFITYLAAGTCNFMDNGIDFDGRLLNGAWYYRVTAVDRNGFESRATKSSVLTW